MSRRRSHIMLEVAASVAGGGKQFRAVQFSAFHDALLRQLPLRFAFLTNYLE